jgi:hypothetical protein
VQFLGEEVALLGDRELPLARDQAQALDRDAEILSQALVQVALLGGDFARLAVEQVEDPQHLLLRGDRKRGDGGEPRLAAVRQRDAAGRAPGAEDVDDRRTARGHLAARALAARDAVLLVVERGGETVLDEQVQRRTVGRHQAHRASVGAGDDEQPAQEPAAQFLLRRGRV